MAGYPGFRVLGYPGCIPYLYPTDIILYRKSKMAAKPEVVIVLL